MILGDVEEVVTTVEIDDETYEEIVRVCIPFLSIFFSSFDTQLLHLYLLSIQTYRINVNMVIKVAIYLIFMRGSMKNKI
jgi:hypothetical protein